MRKPKRILIVEDEAVLRGAIAESCESRGLSVAPAGTLSAARSWLGDVSFDAVLLDVQLPDGNGLSLLEDIAAEIVLVITCHPEPDLYRRLGIGHLAKPFDFADLNEELDRILALEPGSSTNPKKEDLSTYVARLLFESPR